MRSVTFKLMLLGVLAINFSSYAATVAYWKADDGTEDTLIYTEQDVYSYSQDIDDVSGNGNHIKVWSDAPNNSSFWHRGNIPFSVVPQTGQANKLSTQNWGTKPGMITFSEYSEPSGIDVEAFEPTQFTVEVIINPQEAATICTPICRDAYQICPADMGASAFAIRVQTDDSIEAFFVDVSGYKHTVRSAANAVQRFDKSSDPTGLTGKWYHVAVVSDGSTLSLYLTDITDSGNTVLVDSLDMTSSGSPDTAMEADTTKKYSTWHGGGWALYRELVNKVHDNNYRYFGLIDEVRISDSALTQIDFLCNVGRSTSNPAPLDSAVEVGMSTGADTVTVDLGWNKGLTEDPGDPNATIYNPDILQYYLYMSDDQNISSDSTLYYYDAISASGTTGSSTVSLNKDGKYLWRVDQAINLGGGVPSGIDDPNTIAGNVWVFETKLSNFAPEVDAGDTVYTWLSEGTVDVQMAPSVSDDGVLGPYTVLWEETPEEPNLVINSPTAESTTVTVDKVGAYTLTLTANDGELGSFDTVTINVYTDACAAAKVQSGYTRLNGDIDDDCDVDIVDLSILSADWLESTALANPLP